MNQLGLLVGTTALILMQPLTALAAKVSLSGRVEIDALQSPVEDARVMVIFHGHEVGIHEYTVERTVRARTDALGNFFAEIKVPDRRYTWTHATVEISETDVSKQTSTRTICQVDNIGGCHFDKVFRVRPLTLNRP